MLLEGRQQLAHTEAVDGAHTPLFHLSQKPVMPTSKPMLNANAPTKMVGTNTPRRRDGEGEGEEKGEMTFNITGNSGRVSREHSLLRRTIVL